tara:strand:+ start:935 stop:1414 length:480 start_codon:yes stop_codon:yes gene_type:complete
MKVWYLHGLESDPGGPKVDFLKEVAEEVYAPAMNYKNHKTFGELYRKITKEGKPDLIIGSSMGGFFADAIASHFGIDTILLNPALHSRSMIKKLPYGNEYGSIDVFLGSEDKVIDPYKTITKLQERKKEFNLTLGTYSHRTPLTVFKDIYKKTVIDAIK